MLELLPQAYEKIKLRAGKKNGEEFYQWPMLPTPSPWLVLRQVIGIL
jgi:hypothetical protein